MNFEDMSCTQRSWLLGAAGGLLVAIILWLTGSWSFLAGLFIGILVAALIGFVLVWATCEDTDSGVGAYNPFSAKDVPSRTAAGGGGAVPPRNTAPETEGATSPGGAAGETTKPATGAAESAAEPGSETHAPPPPAGGARERGDEEPAVKPSSTLPGEQELAERKGSWRYEGDDAAESAGTRPETLSAPRGGTADDLKKLRGVGPKLEEQLNAHGIYHFDQIAAWSPAEVAWADANLTGVRGKASREGWVEQAKSLKAGG